MAALSSKCLLECFPGPFFLKKIRGTRQTANYLYIFHSSPKHLPKVRSRGLDHSDKCFFMWFFMWFCKTNVEKMVIFEFTGCFYWLPTFVGDIKAFWSLKPQETLVYNYCTICGKLFTPRPPESAHPPIHDRAHPGYGGGHTISHLFFTLFWQ